ncbi:MAG: non-canonical purine NTP pyrophosphatase, RdgB/HAM1 family [Zetaproteobacteria bacterium]|nr:MAG: non-canonical purine NTP pyrophosphatase, RdgB/HAM1 family [Zetaproteobacteria bacterium]
MRRFEGGDLVIATHNKGKAREISALLSPYVSTFYTADELGLPEPEETGTTFVDNAILKAQAAAQASGKVSLADDSGLAVHALGGDPGIYSARWGGVDKDFNLAMRKVHDALGDEEDRSASFVCVLALGWPDGHSEVFEGRVHGMITWPMRGHNGFGYDPIFQANDYKISFAEMDPDEKQAISHRADAFKKLVKNCLEG